MSLKNGSQWILKDVRHVPTPSIISIDKVVMLTLILIYGKYPKVSKFWLKERNRTVFILQSVIVKWEQPW